MVFQINDLNTLNNGNQKCKLNYEDLKQYVDLNWCTIYKGVETGILNEKAIQRYAVDLLSGELEINSSDTTVGSDDLLDIAILTEGYSSKIRIIMGDTCPEKDIYLAKKMQYALLKYLFESDMSNSEKLSLGKEVYIDFGYDSQLHIIFSYTSPPYPSLKLNDESDIQIVLLNYWSDYLIENKKYFKKY